MELGRNVNKEDAMIHNKEPRPEVLEYSFLTSRTARVIFGYMKGKKLEPENELVLNQAIEFMDKVLNGEALISGQHSGLTPSIDGISAFKYGVDAMMEIKGQKQIPLHTRRDLAKALEEIKTSLSCLLEKPVNPQPETCGQLAIAAKFFSVIADTLSRQARQSFFVQVKATW
jgi:hypothetical protein